MSSTVRHVDRGAIPRRRRRRVPVPARAEPRAARHRLDRRLPPRVEPGRVHRQAGPRSPARDPGTDGPHRGRRGPREAPGAGRRAHGQGLPGGAPGTRTTAPSSRPFTVRAVYGTPSFRQLFLDEHGALRGRLNVDAESWAMGRLLRAYSLVLEKYYDVDLRLDYPLIVTTHDPECALERHFRFDLDTPLPRGGHRGAAARSCPPPTGGACRTTSPIRRP